MKTPTKTLDYNALGNVIQTAFGKSSTVKTPSYSIKTTIVGEGRMKMMYTTIVNLTNDKDAILMKRKYAEESEAILAEKLKVYKKDYKELTSESISFDEVSSEIGLEMINYNHFNSKRTAYFRRITILEVK
jgi:hypothetical protein